jgi:hypothetical protein
MAKYGYKVDSIETGTPSTDGTMPTTMTALPDTVDGTVVIEETTPQTKGFKRSKDKAPFMIVVTEDGNLPIKFSIYDISPSVLAILKGGTATAETAWKPSVGTSQLIETALRLKTEGGKLTVNIPKASVTALIKGSLKSDELLTLECTATPLSVDPTKPPYDLAFA